VPALALSGDCLAAHIDAYRSIAAHNESVYAEFTRLTDTVPFLKRHRVMDDASCFLPGTGFWKGLEAVSVAAEDIPALGFENVLNVGHNRVYRRVRASRT
jgi:hypothetical protein